MFRVQFLANSYMILPKGKAKLGSCTLIYTVVVMRDNNSNFQAFKVWLKINECHMNSELGRLDEIGPHLTTPTNEFVHQITEN